MTKWILCQIWMLYILLYLTVFAAGQSIVLPPANATGLIGETAKFDCEVVFGVFEALTWKFNDDIIFYFLDGEEDYMLGTDKYSVTKSKEKFTLEVRDLTYNDGGEYQCLVTTVTAKAVLIVLGLPLITSQPSIPAEGDMVMYRCEANFGGPSEVNDYLDHYPKLGMVFDRTTNLGGVTHVNHFGQYHQLSTVYNMTVNARMHGKSIMCEIGTLNPMRRKVEFATVNVLYSVRNISFSPHVDILDIGTNLTCTAAGNPQSTFAWENVHEPGNLVLSEWLFISEDMVGQNRWRCTGRNAFKDESYTDYGTITFEAQLHTVSEEGGLPVFAVILIIIFIIILMVGFGILTYFLHKKRNKSHGSKVEGVNHQGCSYEPLQVLPTQEQNEIDPARSNEFMLNVVTTGHSENEQNIAGETDIVFTEIIESALEDLGEIAQKIAEIKGKVPEKRTLDCMLQVLTDDKKYVEWFNNRKKGENLYCFVQKLIGVDDSVKSRTRFLRGLVARADFVSKSDFIIKWTEGFISTLKLLLDKGADPTWIPDDSRTVEQQNMPTAQYNFFTVIPKLLQFNSNLKNALMDVLPFFVLKDQCNLEDLKDTPLHALVKSGSTWLNKNNKLDEFHLYKEILTKTVRTNEALLDTIDSHERTPLQQFIQEVNWADETLKHIEEIVTLLKSKTNLNIKGQNDWTVLHYFAEALPIFHTSMTPKLQETLIKLSQEFTTNSNCDAKDVNGRTALHVLVERYNNEMQEQWRKLYHDLVKKLLTKFNTDIQDNHGCTVLHIIGQKVAVDLVGCDIMCILPDLTTLQNVNTKDANKTTPYSWILNKNEHNMTDSSLQPILKNIKDIFVEKGADADRARKGFGFITKYLDSNRQCIASKRKTRLEKLNEYISIPQRYTYIIAYRRDLRLYILPEDLLDELETNYVITRHQRSTIEGDPRSPRDDDEQVVALLDIIYNIQEKEKYLAFLEVLAEDYEEYTILLTGGKWAVKDD